MLSQLGVEQCSARCERPNTMLGMIGRMMYRHVAMYADDLRAAEDFYRLVFAAEVLFREAVSTNGLWATLPLGASWDDATEAGIEIEMVALGRDAFVLPIFAGRSASRIIGLEATIDEMRALRRRLPREAELVTEDERKLVFMDPFRSSGS